MAQYLREFDVLLPVGYTDGSGRVHRQAAIRKMRGHEEALLYDQTLSAGRLVTELIRSCLVRLGSIDAVTSQIVSELYTVDRNYLLLELRRITLGDHLPALYACPRCGTEISVVQDLNSIPVRRLEEGRDLSDVTLQLEDGYIDREGVLHAEIVLTLPRGVDEEFVSSLAEKDPLKAQDVLLLRCIRRFGELPPAALEAYGIKILRDLTMGDRHRLYQALNSQMPAVDFQCPVRCDSCGTSFQGILDVANFFV
ncbi:hypothetical protein [Pelotomaculum sp. PtaB.Bin117]|uniref:T4 family baseplate hub assembly chaperone n=1 Tax=Pelotomaculum sp. PtaB.Bin117 TaxID=1811694 RepID=UPI0009D37DB2|nr:hypothetical protein [Pelotomaculum sp. PtaB.Bin117]OPX90396.1 MAG: T4 bacteriophage base plate protein [Pelotomaculum sp. PtaB.Bin117]